MSDIIEPLRFFNVQKVLPAVYGDELSYYELLAKMEQKINEEVGSINDQNAKLVLMQKAIDDFTSGGYKDDFEEFLDTWFAENLDTIEQYLQEGFGGELEEIRESITTSQEQTLDTVADEYVPFPVEPASKYGTDGQVLSTNADGTTEWQDPVIPSDAQAEQVITQWLNAHPEATTTVQDGTITIAKIARSVFKDSIESLADKIGNVVNPDTLTSGKYIRKTDGAIVDPASDGNRWFVSDFIPVLNCDMASVNCVASSSNAAAGYAVYDSSHNYVRRGYSPYTFTTGDAYIRFCFFALPTNTAPKMANYGSTALDPRDYDEYAHFTNLYNAITDELENELERVDGLESALNDSIESLADKIGNVVNPNTLTPRKYIRKTDGAIVDAASDGDRWHVSDFIPVLNCDMASINSVPSTSGVAAAYAVYDGSRNYIRNGYSPYTYTTGDAYIRFCFHPSSGSPKMANYGSTALDRREYDEYAHFTNLYNAITNEFERVDGLESALNDSIESLANKIGNVVNPDTLTSGKYIRKADGAIVDGDSNWFVSDFIPVLNCDMASINSVLSTSGVAAGYAVYDSSHNYVRKGYSPYTYTTDDAYIRFCFFALPTNTAPKMANYGSTALDPREYDEYEHFTNLCNSIANDKPLYVEKNRYVEVLIDKVLMIGDSTTEGLVSDYPYLRNRNNRWSSSEYLSRLNGWNIQNDGHFGWNASDWINNTYQSGTYGDFQIATIEYGYNQEIPNTIATDVAPYEDYNDYANTPCGNYCKLIAILHNENPNLIILPVIQANIGTTTKETIIAVSSYYNLLGYIDLTTTDLNNNKYHGYYSAEAQSQGNIDRVHFNILGYSRKADWLRYFILKILVDNLTDSTHMISLQQSEEYSN